MNYIEIKMNRIVFDDLLNSFNSRIGLAGITDRVKVEHQKKIENVFNYNIEIQVDDKPYADFSFYDNAENDYVESTKSRVKKISSSFTIFKVKSLDYIKNTIKYRGTINSYSIYVNGDYVFDFDTFLNILFPLPDNKKLDIIVEVFNAANYGYKIKAKDITFDFATRTYSLSENIENKEKKYLTNLFSHFETPKFCKYTSLDTFFTMIQHKNIRMNGLMAMNDKHEAFFINQYLYSDINERDRTIVNSDNILITSFTSLEDDLNMWRLYGDNACGICLVFSDTTIETNSTFNKIIYGEENLSKYKSIIDELKKNDIDFKFKSVDEFKYFFKSKEYSYEQEYRLILKTKGKVQYYIENRYKSITPYKDYNLLGHSGIEKKSNIFPLRLDKIILGPNLPSIESNYPLLVNICDEIWNVEVVKSNILTYR